MSIRRAKLARQIPIFRGGGCMKKVKLGEICEIVTGSTPKSSTPNYWNGEYKWITPAEISDDDFIVFDTQRKITKLGIEETGLKSFPTGTVLLSSRAPIGKVAISGCEMYCNQGFKNFICSNKINNEYLYYFFKSRKNYLNILGRGATFKEISKSIVSDIEIFLPTYGIQRKQVKVLKKIDKLIYTRKEQLIEFEYLVKSRFNEMFGGNKQFESIDNLFDIIDGDRGKNYPKSDELFDEEYCLFLNTKNVTKNGFSFKIKQFITETKDKLLRKGKLERHDIVLTTRGTVGNVAYYDESINYDHLRINSGMVILRAKKTELNRQFILHVLKDDNYYKRLISGSAQPQLPITKIKKILLPLPPLSLQNEFADFVAQVDKSQFACQKAIKLWRNSLKSSII